MLILVIHGGTIVIFLYTWNRTLYGPNCIPERGAVDGEDFTGQVDDPSSAVILPAGASSVTCDVEILDDDHREEDEVFSVEIGAVSCGGTLGVTTTTTVTIIDNDGMLMLEENRA